MIRGRSCGGGQSSLGYLFGSGDAQTETDTNTPEPPPNPSQDATVEAPSGPDDETNLNQDATTEPSQDSPAPEDDKSSDEADMFTKRPPSSTNSKTNNYYRVDGQNCGNFITDRPTTKVHAPPGGSSSIGFLFGGDGK